MTDKLANYIPGFRKSHEAQHFFKMVLEKMEKGN